MRRVPFLSLRVESKVDALREKEGRGKTKKKENEPKDLRISLVVARKLGRAVFARFRIFIHRCAKEGVEVWRAG